MKNLTPITREEKYLHAIATGEAADITPVTGEEHFLAAIASGETPNREPKTRKEYFLNECANGTGGGGDSDFTTATMTVVGRPGGLVAPIDIVNVYTDETFGTNIIGSLIPNPGTYEIVLYKGSQKVVIGNEYTVTGSVEKVPDADESIVTGDFTITYTLVQ